MKVNNQLKLLKLWGYPLRWQKSKEITRGGQQFIATYRGRGIKCTLRAEAKKHDIMQMASTVRRELVAADKGELNAEAEELWSRETGQRVDSRAPAQDPERD